jgi:hypothetical protein
VGVFIRGWFFVREAAAVSLGLPYISHKTSQLSLTAITNPPTGSCCSGEGALACVGGLRTSAIAWITTFDREGAVQHLQDRGLWCVIRTKVVGNT